MEEATCPIKRNYRARTRKQYLNYLHGLTDRRMEKAAKSSCSQIIRRLLVFSIIDNNQLFHRTKIVPLTGRVNCRSHLDYQGTRNPRPIRYDQRCWRENYFKHDHWRFRNFSLKKKKKREKVTFYVERNEFLRGGKKYIYIYIEKDISLERVENSTRSATSRNENNQKRKIQRRFWFPRPTRFDGSFDWRA